MDTGRQLRFGIFGRGLYLLLASVCAAGLLVPSLRADDRIDAAIYNDLGLIEGTAWQPSVEGIQALLDTYGYTWVEVGPDRINSDDTLIDDFRMLMVPGGWAGGYNFYIEANGYANIRAFVEAGGGYMGFCAGAFFASDRVVWRPNVGDRFEFYNYPLDLLPIVAQGTLPELIGWTERSDFNVIRRGAEMLFPAVQEQVAFYQPMAPEILYYGGPYFQPLTGTWPEETRIIARYDLPGQPNDGQVMMLLTPVGEGMVYLSGTHPEVSVNEEGDVLFHDPENHRFLRAMIAEVLQEPIPQLSSIATVSEATLISLETQVGIRYQLEVRENGNTWVPIGDLIIGTGTMVEVPIPAPSPNREWRAVPQ